MKCFIILCVFAALSLAEQNVNLDYDVIEEYAPYEAAIALAEANGKIIEECIMPFVQCKISAGSSFPAVMKCGVDFLQCAIGGCKGEVFQCQGDECYTPDDAAVDLFFASDLRQFDGSIIDQCKMMHQECLMAASGIVQKAQCFIQLGLCLGTKAVGCSKECIPTLVQCKIDSIGDFGALLRCSVNFIHCVVAGCTGHKPANALIQYDEGITQQCQDMFHDCQNAASGIFQRMQCVVQMGLCMSAKLVTCAKDCVAPMLMCKSKAIGSFSKLLQCNIEFVKCAIGGCSQNSTVVYGGPSIEDHCREMFHDCSAEATGVLQKAKCLMQLGLCLTAKLVDCSKDCVAPMLKCKADAIGDWSKMLHCNVEFVKCAMGGCKNLTTNALATNDAILDQCQSLFHDCMAAAWGIVQKAKCLVQSGLCMTAKLVDCAKDCVAPMLMCKAKAIGSFTELLHCNVEFVKCAVGGCAKSSLTYEHLTDAAPQESLDVVKECLRERDECIKEYPQRRQFCQLRSYLCIAGKLMKCGHECMRPFILCHRAADGDKEKSKKCTDEVQTCLRAHCKTEKPTNAISNEGMLEQCQGLLHDCLSAADGLIQKGQCMLQFGLCMAAQVVECGKDCVAPMLMCKAKGLGSFTKLIQCNIEFVKCVAGGCSKPVADDDYSPYEAAIAEYEENASIVEECKITHQDCMKDAQTGRQKIQCFIQLGLCIGSKAVGCSSQCIMPLITCRLSSGGSWPALLNCGRQFLTCVIGGCKQELVAEDDYTPYEAAIAKFEENASIVEECKITHQDCMKDAQTGRQKIQCFIQLGLCIGSKAVGCSSQCIMPLITCRLSSGGSWPALLNCGRQFLSCVIGGCKQAMTYQNDYSPYAEAVAEFVENGIISEECKITHTDCIQSAQSGHESIQCFIQLGLCIGAKVFGCTKKCVAPLVMCRLSAGHDWHAIFKCGKQFLACAYSGCKEGYVAGEDRLQYESALAEVEENEGILEECKGLLDDCLNAADGLFQRGQCMVQFGICMSAHAVDCGKDCVAPMLMCKAKGLGSFTKLIHCNIEFVKCLYTSCTKPVDEEYSLSEALLAEIQESDGIMEECKGLLDDCLNAASGIFQRGQCMIQFGICMTAKAVDCGKDCVAPMLLCKAKGLGSFTKLIQCNIEFVKCIATSCTKPDTYEDFSSLEATIAGLIEDNGSIIDECKITHQDCMKDAQTGRQKIQCFIQLGLCIGSKAVGCSSQCIMPLITCRLSSGGSWPALLNCGRQFLSCVIGGCKQEAQWNAESAYNAVVADYVAEGYEVPEECKVAYNVCAKAIRSGEGAKLCLGDLGSCLFKRVIDCAKGCAVDVSLCTMLGGTGWENIVKCAKKFVTCTVTTCIKVPTVPLVDYDQLEAQSAYNLIVSEAEAVGYEVPEECKVAYNVCVHAIRTGEDGKLCLKDLGSCFLNKAVDCVKGCAVDVSLCTMLGGTGWENIVKCAKKFVTCTVTTCIKVPTYAAVGDNLSAKELVAECQKKRVECVHQSTSPMDRVRCSLRFGFCIAGQLLECSKPCQPALFKCKEEAGGDMQKIQMCIHKFVGCLVTSCGGKKSQPAITNVAVKNDIIKTVEDACKSLYNICHKLAFGPIAKLTCFNLHMACTAIKTVGCAKDCIAPLVSCQLHTVGQLFPTIACFKTFIECSLTCKPPPGNGMMVLPGETDSVSYEVAAQMFESANSISIMKCLSPFLECWGDAGSEAGIGAKAECVGRLAICLGTEVIGCAAHCIPDFGLCALGAHGDMIKTSLCGVKFLYCTKKGCAY